MKHEYLVYYQDGSGCGRALIKSNKIIDSANLVIELENKLSLILQYDIVIVSYNHLNEEKLEDNKKIKRASFDSFDIELIDKRDTSEFC